jgi:hypothetical protein
LCATEEGGRAADPFLEKKLVDMIDDAVSPDKVDPGYGAD